jgi:hypothetical protein
MTRDSVTEPAEVSHTDFLGVLGCASIYPPLAFSVGLLAEES